MKADDTVYYTEEDEGQAYLTTLLLHGVNPAIDCGVTYELVMELLMYGTSEEDVAECARKIRDTAFLQKSESAH